MLSVQEVSFKYQHKKSRSYVHVLENVSARFETGRVYAILGPSGSGKTTLLSLLGGLEEPQQGKVMLDDINIREIGYQKLRREHIAFVFQNYLLFPYLNAIDNMILASAAGGEKTEQRRKRAASILEGLGLQSDEMVRKVRNLSGGQQQRVAIARCLFTGAPYILADEPTGNLDSENAKRIMEILLTLSREQNKCVIIATHSEMIKSNSDVSFCLQDKTLRPLEGSL